MADIHKKEPIEIYFEREYYRLLKLGYSEFEAKVKIEKRKIKYYNSTLVPKEKQSAVDFFNL